MPNYEKLSPELLERIRVDIEKGIYVRVIPGLLDDEE